MIRILFRRELLIHSLSAAAFVAFASAASAQQQQQPQQPRADTLELFARGVISADSGDSFSTFSPDGREFYFTRHRPDWSAHRIMMSRYDGGSWSKPVVVAFSGKYNDREPKLSPDGRRLWFSSNRPVGQDTARRRDLDLWYVERDASGRWGAAQHPGAPINTSAQEFCPVITANGSLYFISTRAGGIGSGSHVHNVWRATARGNGFDTPQPLGPEVNTGYETNVFVSADEHLLFLSRDGAPDGLGGDDLYGSEWRGNAWSPARNLGEPLNTREYEYGPLLSPDNKWLYFTSHRNGNADIFRAPFNLVRDAFRKGEDREGVRRAALDYIEGFYEGDTAKIVRSIRPEVSKYGFDLPRGATKYAGESMSWKEIIDYTKSVKARNRAVPDSWPKLVQILDVQDQTAAAKVTAWWGTDYLLLARYEGKWMILHILWQSLPPK